MAGLLFRNLNDVARTHGLVARAALGVEEAQDLFERFGIGGVAKERTLAGDADEVFVAQFVEMVGESGIGDVEFLLDFADHKALGMRLQQELHDAQAGFGAHGREHIRVTGDLVGRELAGHISIIAEIWDAVKCCWLVASGELGIAWRESRQLAPRRSMVEMYSVSREIHAAAGSFDYVRLAPHSAQDDRHVGCERVQGVRRSINFRPSNSPPKRSLDGAPVYGHLTGARDGGPCDRRPGA